MKRKQPLRVDEDGHKIDIEGIDATSEAVGRAMLKPETRRLRVKSRKARIIRFNTESMN